MASAAASPAGSSSQASSGSGQTLTGIRLTIAGGVLALANLIVVLDTTVANVSIPHIAGSLGVSSDEATWVVTFYSVAEAIAVPLTGWLSKRFGTIRLFLFSLIGFGIFSMLCGLSSSLIMLVMFRIGQGLCGGPLIPMSQTLIFRIFPKEKQAGAMGVWALTTLLAPVLGPVLGGAISDNWSWPWIFFINVPIIGLCIFGTLTLLLQAESETERLAIDKVGLVLMVVWIACLQVMLDTGNDHDWFGSTMIIYLAIVAAVGFMCFLAWELTDRTPIVDLRVFRHRGFTFGVLALALSYGCFFSAIIVIPQWLQGGLGYTATNAGYVLAGQGVLAIGLAPIVARLGTKFDPRLLVFIGIVGLGLSSIGRSQWSTEGDFWSFAGAQVFQGIWLPFFFVPLNVIVLGAVEPDEVASAAGVMGFCRSLSGAVGTSIATTLWANQTQVDRTELVNIVQPGQIAATLQQGGMSTMRTNGMIEQLVNQQSSSLAANHVFMLAAFMFFLSSAVIWLTPRPRDDVDTSAAH